MKCGNCGADTAARLCEYCGSLVNEHIPAHNVPPAPPAPPKKKKFPVGGVVAILAVGALLFWVGSRMMPVGELTHENAVKRLEALNRKITVNTPQPVRGYADLNQDDISDALPDIEKYPAQVTNSTADYVEIFSSTEKAGSGTDGWLVEMAKEFNASGATVGGKRVSVMLRGISSGVGMDYIASGKYRPDAFSPSNELWGGMLEARGVSVALAEKRLIGNVAGVLFSKKANQELLDKYGAITLQSVNQAVIANEIAMGYTNPFASSAGLNYLVSTLYAFDASNPLGDAAVGEFEKFSANVPFVAYTTLQMRESAKSGTLNGFILEYQSYANLPDLRADYIFTPFGVRHDSPVYEIGELSAEKKEILQQFIAFCKTDAAQRRGSQMGFNNLEEYTCDLAPDGETVVQAQRIWKEKKNAGVDVSAVFIADISGSMQGTRLSKLKESLVKGSKFIGSNNSIGLVSFSDDVNINLPIAPFDINQRALFTGTVQSLNCGGGTAMYDAVAVAIGMLLEEKAQNPNAKLMLFVLTDGETNRGNRLSNLEPVLRTLGIPVHTIGYEANVSELQALSRICEAACINADTQDVVYTLGNLFNAEM